MAGLTGWNLKHFQPIAQGIDVIPVMAALARHPELWNQNTLRTRHPGTAHADVSDIWVWFNGVLAKASAVTLGDLNLSTRACRVLDAFDIRSVEQLIRLSYYELRRLDTLGKVTCDEIVHALSKVGLQLGAGSGTAALGHSSNIVQVADDREVISYPAWEVLPQVRPLVFDLMRRVEGVRIGRVIITKLPPGKRILPHVDGGAPATYFTRYQIALQSLPGALFHIGDETVNFRTGEAWMIDNRSEHSVENNSADDRIVVIVDIRSE